MGRKPRIEVEGGLYHVFTRGNNRQQIYKSKRDYLKFLSLLEAQKAKLPFYLYAYCLMPNHFHLLIERCDDSISQIMQRVLTGYSKYHNRMYQGVGHLFQNRYKAILCQTDQYLAELVRYIHLNPVRAKLVRRPETYAFSSDRAYLGLEPSAIVDVEPVLRQFGARRELAREMYQKFVLAGMYLGRQEDLYRAEGGRVLGSEEFVDSMIHRMGDVGPAGARRKRREAELDLKSLVEAVELAAGMERNELCGPGKSARVVLAKEALALVGREAGATYAALAKETGLESSAVCRRYESARKKIKESKELRALVKRIEQKLGRGLK